jgi:cysteine-rich repeat protein
VATASLARLAAIALVIAPVVSGFAAPPRCQGRYVITHASGEVVDARRDTIVLDVASAVVDPACGAADLRERVAGGKWRIAARWSGCRGHRIFRLRARASVDCTVLRGAISGTGARRSRLVATASRCGDGIADGGRGERCDDANLIDDDGCDAGCGRCVDPATLTSTWAAIQANVFDRACTACHGERATAGLDFRAPGTYERIVDVPAGSGLFEVKAGDHLQSLIWLKMAKVSLGGLDDLPGGGMPFGFPLPADVVNAFGVWIDAGAPHDGFVDGAQALLVACD